MGNVFRKSQGRCTVVVFGNVMVTRWETVRGGSRGLDKSEVMGVKRGDALLCNDCDNNITYKLRGG